MKVLVVSPYTDPALGGVSQVVPSMAKAAANEEVRIDWISTAEKEVDWKPMTAGARQKIFSRISRRDLIWSGSMVAWFKDHVQDYDLVHFHTIFSPLMTRLAMGARRKAIPYWVTPHGMLDSWAIRHRGWKKRIYWKFVEGAVFKNANAVHVLHRGEAESVRWMGITTPTVEIPNGIEVGSGGSSGEVDTFWNRYPQAKGKKRILFLGRIHPKKGIEYLIRALPQILKQIPDTCLVIAGPDEGGTKAGLEDLSRELGVGDRILWTGLLSGDEKEAVMRGSDCFVLPSHSEGLSLALLEAMALGLPCAYTKECYFDEAIRRGGAWKIEREPEQIESVLISILGDVKGSREKAKTAQELVLENYRWESIGKRLREEYQKAIFIKK